MSGKPFKRSAVVVGTAMLALLPMVGTASATTRPGEEAVAYIEQHDMYKPYVWGATGPHDFDCSGLIQYAVKHSSGISLPHETDAQYAAIPHSNRHQTEKSHQVEYGDILFFWGWDDNGHWGIEHEGIYIGNGEMIDANSTEGYVTREEAFYNWGFSYITYGWVN
jgi:cell wall-associated NlpC family hydrolase